MKLISRHIMGLIVSMIWISIAVPAQANESCAEKPAVKRWENIDGSITMALRSNACHFWSWAKDNASSYLTPELLQTTALITGDPHHENFSHIFSNGNRVYVLNDIDDVGNGPILLDLLKFLGVSRSIVKSENKLSTEEVLKAYIKGLEENQKDYAEVAENVPKLLKKDFEVSESKFFDKYQEKSKKDAPGGNFVPDDNLTLWQELDQSAFQNKEAQIFFAAIYTALTPDFHIIDRAHSAKTRGGSSGLVRYLFSLRNLDTDERHILEFKPIESTSLDVYQPKQLNSFERAKKALKVYWPSEYPAVFGIYGEPGDTYLMRPKYKKYVNFRTKDLAENPKDFAELTYYIAYHLGQMHGKQISSAASLAERLNSLVDNKDLQEKGLDLVSLSQNLVNAYLEEVKELHKNR